MPIKIPIRPFAAECVCTCVSAKDRIAVCVNTGQISEEAALQLLEKIFFVSWNTACSYNVSLQIKLYFKYFVFLHTTLFTFMVCLYFVSKLLIIKCGFFLDACLKNEIGFVEIFLDK